MDAPEPGTWVKVIGLVVDRRRHPDDAVVEFFSHNEQWAGHIRLDRLQAADRPEWASRCARMYELKTERYVRCTEHEGHGGRHKAVGIEWSEKDSDGYFEEAT